MYQLVDTIARELGMKQIDGLVLTPDFNAAFSLRGLRRRSYIYIGLPLFSILTAEESVAVLGHEVAHGVNGDITRGWFIGHAIDTLASWYYLLMPTEIFSSESGAPGLIMAPMNLLLAGLAQTAYGGAYVLLLLVMRDSQRAEYLADYLATTVSGTDGMLSSLDKLHYGDTYMYATQRAALNPDTGNIFTHLPSLMASVPEREIERIRRTGQMEGSRLDTTHPPTVYRRQFLESRRVTNHLITLSDEEYSKISSELEHCYDEGHRLTVSNYLNQLYH
jgi:heat shock protein HtpX